MEILTVYQKMTNSKGMSVQLDTPIQYLKGVGPKLGDILKRKDIETVSDFLEWYPRGYEDRRAARSIASLQPGEVVSLKAQVVGVRSYNLGKSRRKIHDVTLRDSTGQVHCKFFRVPYRGYFERFRPHHMVRVAGKVTHYRGRIEFHHPDIQDIEGGEANEDALVPLYTETEGLSAYKIRKLMSSALENIEFHTEALPDWVESKYQLKSRKKAIEGLHLPPKDAGAEFLQGRSDFHRRIIFEEFFWLELHLAMRRSGMRKDSAPRARGDFSGVERLKENLPFQLTSAQLRAFEAIAKDMQQGHPMHRMVQGDVGCGKTLVAFMAAVFGATSGLQTSLMVPTEILAEQHFKTARKFLEPLGLKVAMLSGKMRTRERALILHDLKMGAIDVCVGTHALLTEGVDFKNLGLVIVDEQHRFGVSQRDRLKSKGTSPHFLVMTATPIPRTLAMTVYGDLDVSIIDEMPAGRKPIVTRVVYGSKRTKVFEFVRDQLKKGRQAYVVYPLVEESEVMDLKNAETQYKVLCKQFSEFRVGLLHGQMKSDEKDRVMMAFRKNEIQMLVSTTVIEVGVDVPNANIMLIEHAERFGLSQLHQLRGRVGRGTEKSYCVLLLGYALSEDAKSRMEIMARTNNGFEIAEADLEIRGPGEFLGTRQSGLPGFKMANLVRDMDILQQARQAAFELIEKDPEFRKKSHAKVREQLELNQRWTVG